MPPLIRTAISVAQRLARLSQQYPFLPARCIAATRPAVPRRCLAHQASASREAEHKQAHADGRHTTSDGQAADGEASASTATPPPLFAPLINSILAFIERRAQPTPPHADTSLPQSAPAEPASHPTADTASLQARPALDLDDPSISLLFPRLPLAPKPPLKLRPPYPHPPVTRSAARRDPSAYATYQAWYSAQPLRTRVHMLLLHAAMADAGFVQYLERLAARRG